MKALAPQGKAHLQGLVQAAQQRIAPQRPQGEAIEASELGRIAQAATMAEQQYRVLESDWHDAREAVARTQARLEQAQAEARAYINARRAAEVARERGEDPEMTEEELEKLFLSLA